VIFLDPLSMIVGALFGIALATCFAGFAVLLVTHAGKDLDKHGLDNRSRRHSAIELFGGEVDGALFPALPVVAPHRDSAEPGSPTVAGLKPPRHNVKPAALATTSRSRPESPSGLLPPT
jgi:hypothetical protein